MMTKALPCGENFESILNASVKEKTTGPSEKLAPLTAAIFVSLSRANKMRMPQDQVSRRSSMLIDILSAKKLLHDRRGLCEGGSISLFGILRKFLHLSYSGLCAFYLFQQAGALIAFP